MSVFSGAELARYSVTRALSRLYFDHNVGGLEGEIDQALKSEHMNQTGQQPAGFLMPLACLKNLSAVTAGAGAFLVGSAPATIIPALRNKSVAIALGAQVWEGLGNQGLKNVVRVPRQATVATGQWLASGQALTEGAKTFGSSTLQAHRCAAMTVLSKELLRQSSLGIENFVRDDLAKTVGTAIDLAAIAGTGNAQPLGILNTPDVGSVTFGAAATRSKVVSFQQTLAAANGSGPGGLGYVTTPTTASKWMTTAEISGYPKWLWEGNLEQGTVAGSPAVSTNQMPGDQVIFGAWPALVIGIWGEAVDITVDPYSAKRTGEIELVIDLFADATVTQPACFVTSSDSGAQ